MLVNLVTTAVPVLLAALMALAAFRKLTHRQPVVESYARVGVPEGRLDSLAVILLLGAAGLVLGLRWAPLGIAAAAGALCYFVVAAAFHVRAGDARSLPVPLALAVLAVAALALRLVMR